MYEKPKSDFRAQLEEDAIVKARNKGGNEPTKKCIRWER
jgi:hypothetical protein